MSHTTASSSHNPMRFGLLGTGPWADMTHGPALHAHPGVELVGVWGRRPEAAEELAARFSTRAWDDVDALLAECDAVAIALPPDVQAPLAERAARAGCHLLLDKPVATTVEGAARVVDAAAAHSVASVVFFTLHFQSDTAAWLAKQAAVEGWLVGRADWLSPVFGGGDTPFLASVWRRERGALWDLGPHALSVLLPTLGEVTEVSATAGPGDTVHLSLRHHSGASSTVAVSLTMPPEAAHVTADIRGSAGASVLPESEETPEQAFAAAIDTLRDAAHTGNTPLCDVRFASRVTEILASAEALLPALPAGDPSETPGMSR